VLGFRDGFSHMEWYRKADGEVVFGEMAARPPGGRMVDLMNYATDADLFSAWAEAVTRAALSGQARAGLVGRLLRCCGIPCLRASIEDVSSRFAWRVARIREVSYGRDKSEKMLRRILNGDIRCRP
jgi:hypothetical protein